MIIAVFSRVDIIDNSIRENGHSPECLHRLPGKTKRDHRLTMGFGDLRVAIGYHLNGKCRLPVGKLGAHKKVHIFFHFVTLHYNNYNVKN